MRLPALDIFIQALPFLLLSGFGEIAAGIVLKGFLDYIYLFPGIFLLMPTLMDMRGSISNALASRLGTAYQLGFVHYKFGFNDEVKKNFLASLILSLLTAAFVGTASFFVAEALHLPHISLFWLVLIAMLSSFLGSLLLSFIAIYMVFFAIKRKLEPDNVVIPLLTTVGDILMVTIVYLLMVSFTRWLV